METAIAERAGLQTSSGFDLLQRQAKMLASSSLVPKEFQNNIANCIIGLEIAHRIGVSPLSVLQNLYIVHGKPGWSSQFIIAAINSTGHFSPLRFQISAPGPEKEVTYTYTEGFGQNKTTKHGKEVIRDRTCIAWATEKTTGERLESPLVSIEMAVKEGWFSKAGSKWQTMPELMIRYRAATFFGRLYAPEILMGMQTADELTDVAERKTRADDVAARFIKPEIVESKEPEREPGEDIEVDVAAPSLSQFDDGPL